jgi:MYXO-CTERM domain-containing protein
MRFFRCSMIAAALGGLAVSAQLLACGDDEVAAGPVDAGPVEGGPTGPVLTVSDKRSKAFLGQTVKVDGAAVAPNITADFVWKVIAAPSESAVKTETIQDATTGSPSFKPDVLGLYSLEVSGTKDGVASSVILFVEALDAPVFWREATFTQSSGSSMASSLSTHVGGVHGSFSRSVDCPVEKLDGGSTETQLALMSARIGGNAGDVWEGPPGTPSRVVFPTVDGDSSGSVLTTTLTVATSQSACGAAEAKIVDKSVSDGGSGLTLPDAIVATRLSPDGNRIAYAHNVQGRARLGTMGFDGADVRDISAFQSGASGGLDQDAGVVITASGGGFPMGPVAPRWKDATHVGWITFFGPTATTENPSDWELYVAEDKVGATPELVMRCTGSGVRSFDFLPDGSIVATARHLASADSGAPLTMNALVYRANATKECEVARNLTNNTLPNAVARDLALSPDKTQIAFFSGTGTGFANTSNDALALVTVPVDGSRPATQVPGSAGPADPGIGPRWVAGGTMLTWGRFATMGNGGGLPMGVGHVASIPAAGGTPRTLATGSAEQISLPDGGSQMSIRLTYGIGQGCGVSAVGAGSPFVAATGAIGLAALVARRKRRSAKNQ